MSDVLTARGSLSVLREPSSWREGGDLSMSESAFDERARKTVLLGEPDRPWPSISVERESLLFAESEPEFVVVVVAVADVERRTGYAHP